MQKKTEKIMVLCDREEEYARLMTEFLQQHKNLPWKLRTYTSGEQLLEEQSARKESPDALAMLVVAESTYTEEMQKLQAGKLIILNESGVLPWKGLMYVDKYQQAEEVLRYLLTAYMEIAETPLPRLRKSGNTIFVGNYSPVRRTMQTSFALTMSQLLAQKHPTLYLNFEHYAGIAELLPDADAFDLADLLYFLNAEQEKFLLRMRTMLHKKGNLDYIPPMKSGQNLLTITTKEWLTFLQKIEESGEYEYVILDLSESMQGLFEILRQCKYVFTLVREDRISNSKLLQYEQILSLYEYEDVKDKTKKLNLTHIHKLPEELEQLTKGDLADMVKQLIKTMEGG